MESFFATVKSEEAERFDSHGEAKMALFDFIEVFYNQQRRHSTLGQIRTIDRISGLPSQHQARSQTQHRPVCFSAQLPESTSPSRLGCKGPVTLLADSAWEVGAALRAAWRVLCRGTDPTGVVLITDQRQIRSVL